MTTRANQPARVPAPMPEETGPKPYTVTNLMERVSPAQNGSYQKVIEVTYQTARGTISTVTVPVEQATPENVRAAIEAAVAKIEAIYNL